MHSVTVRRLAWSIAPTVPAHVMMEFMFEKRLSISASLSKRELIISSLYSCNEITELNYWKLLIAQQSS